MADQSELEQVKAEKERLQKKLNQCAKLLGRECLEKSLLVSENNRLREEIEARRV
jgi:hypothetical protein